MKNPEIKLKAVVDLFSGNIDDISLYLYWEPMIIWNLVLFDLYNKTAKTG